MSDFELALLQVLHLNIRLFFFQCLSRKVLSLGSASLYTSDSAAKSLIHKAAALAFLPPMSEWHSLALEWHSLGGLSQDYGICKTWKISIVV